MRKEESYRSRGLERRVMERRVPLSVGGDFDQLRAMIEAKLLDSKGHSVSFTSRDVLGENPADPPAYQAHATLGGYEYLIMIQPTKL